LGVVSSRVMRAGLVGSSHTVCQIPEYGVYQIPPRLRRCLPTGMSWESVGSHTPTMISLLPLRRALVMSYENLSKPPSCVPSRVPLTQTLDCQSTAPKLSCTFRPDQPAGVVNVRR
jgi:hypothetical protein